MREIKFRLVYKGQIVGYEDHVLIGNGVNIRQRQPGQTMWTLYNPTEIGRFLKHDHKDQFVGLEDKNGVEIYEGDIVDTADNYGIAQRYTVEWVENLAAWGFGNVDEPECYGGLPEWGLEVIGNIHENPELLKD